MLLHRIYIVPILPQYIYLLCIIDFANVRVLEYFSHPIPIAGCSPSMSCSHRTIEANETEQRHWLCYMVRYRNKNNIEINNSEWQKYRLCERLCSGWILFNAVIIAVIKNCYFLCYTKEKMRVETVEIKQHNNINSNWLTNHIILYPITFFGESSSNRYYNNNNNNTHFVTFWLHRVCGVGTEWNLDKYILINYMLVEFSIIWTSVWLFFCLFFSFYRNQPDSRNI